MSTVVRVELGPGSYDVVVARDYDALRAAVAGRRRIALVSDAQADRACGALVRSELTGLRHATFLMGSGEGAKSMATVEDLCRRFAQWGLLRGDLVVAVGGGVVGDTAGFAAATYHRGVDVVHVPTTLLAMVDSSIGGKTGVNLPEGKNLVGAFHQPRGVYANPVVLASLPPREYRCGLGEIAKYALMDGLSFDVDAVRRRDPAALDSVIAACAAIKARYVAADEFDSTGARAALNYGHTLAHALETATGHGMLHGEAVAVGLVFAANLAGALERIEPAQVARHEEVVGELGLPLVAPPGLRADDLVPLMSRDKKSGGALTFVLAGQRGIERVDDPDPAAVRKALATVGVEA